MSQSLVCVPPPPPNSHTDHHPSTPLHHCRTGFFTSPITAIGDWVGVGPQRDSCRDCKWCNKGEESCCAGFQGLYDKEHTGGYATAVQAPERLVFALPEELTSNEEALKVMAPLLCAGVTTFAPLARHVGSSEPCKVGVVGIGGLGHLGVQFAKALGHTVVAISRSRNKEALAKELGADEVLPFDEPEAVKAATGTFDFVLCTASHKYDLAGYLNLLKARGTMCVVGAPALDDALTFRPQSLIFGEKSLVGSLIGGVESMTSMLNTAAKFSILPMSQMRKFEDANAAMHDLRDGKPRFRYVLDVEGFKKEKGLDAAYMVL